MKNKYDKIMQRIKFQRLESHVSITSKDIRKLEKRLGHSLPEDYGIFLSKYGLTAGTGDVRFGILNDPDQDESSIEEFYGINPDDGRDLYDLREAFEHELPLEFLPIASSGAGHIVLALSGESEGEVYWWLTHGGSEDPYEDLELISHNFDQFMNSLHVSQD